MTNGCMPELEVISSPAAAALALDPVKSRLLAELATPASASSLAAKVGLTRQKVNYHLRALEGEKLVRPVEQRKWGGLTERLMQASAGGYVVSPEALGPIAADPVHTGDKLSAGYLIAVAARTLKEVSAMWRDAKRSDQRFAATSIDTVICFRNAQQQAAFSLELNQAVTKLAARYHDSRASDGPAQRLVLLAYPDQQHAGSLTKSS